MVLLLNYRARGACIANPGPTPPRMVSAYRVPWGVPRYVGTYGTGTYAVYPAFVLKGPQAARLVIHGQ